MSIEIPEKCVNCDKVKLIQAIIAAHEQQEAGAMEQLLSDDLDRQAEELSEQNPELSEAYGDGVVKQLAETARKFGYQQWKCPNNIPKRIA